MLVVFIRRAEYFGRKTWREKDKLEDRGIDGRIILKCLKDTDLDDVVWIILDEESGQWQAFVNIIMNGKSRKVVSSSVKYFV